MGINYFPKELEKQIMSLHDYFISSISISEVKKI